MEPKIDPQHLTAWRLFITSYAKLIAVIDQQLKDADLIPLNWYDVLIELYEAPDHRLRMSDLADRVVITRSGLTRLVDRLEQDGLLHRELDPQDRRGFYAILTAAGIDALRAAWPIYAAGINDLFAQHMSTDEAETMAQIFGKIVKGIGD